MSGESFSNVSHQPGQTTASGARIGLAAAGFFVATVLVMHVVQRDLNPLDYFLSQYANGRGGWLMALALIVFGLGVLGIAAGLYRTFEPGSRGKIGIILFGLFGAGLVVAGIFPIDVRDGGDVMYTLTGQIHGFAVTIGVIGFAVGTFLLRGVFARHPQWEVVSRLTRWFALAILLGLVLWIVAGETEFFPGLVQRIWFVVVLTWLVILGVQLDRSAAAGTERDLPGKAEGTG
jgi:hypothetical protein